MQRAFTSIFFFFTLPLATIGCLIPLTTHAQVTPDGTTSTTVNQDGNNFTINQGNRVGDNLFHSFNEFSVPTLGSAAFNNAGNINIIAGAIALDGLSILDAGNLGIGEGDAGNISLQASGDISLVGSGILSNIGSQARGNVGNIELIANSISFTENSQLQAGFFAGGQGNETTGKISLQPTFRTSKCSF